MEKATQKREKGGVVQPVTAAKVKRFCLKCGVRALHC
jgi:hypothetical protein